MSYLIKNNESYEKYNQIWKKVQNTIDKNLIVILYTTKNISKLKWNLEKSTQIGKINTNFHNNKISKEGTQCICLSVILIDSVFREVIIITLKCF